MAPIVEMRQGTTPLLVSMPHAGTVLPADLAPRLTAAASALPDTDWHVDRLYDFLDDLGAGAVRAVHARLVVDANRPPDDASLYPGRATTRLCPTELFDGSPVYRPGQAPDAAEIAARRRVYWQPYHDALTDAVTRLRARYGYALLYDAHSIRSRVPRLFDGTLPTFSIGSNDGRAADAGLVALVARVCRAATDGPTVVDGRFKGGYITRHYGDPANHVHAVQMELAQAAYMDEAPPYAFVEAKAARLRPTLRAVLLALLGWGRARYGV